MAGSVIKPLIVPRKTPMMRFAMGSQCFLLRRGWMGSMQDICLVLQHKGRTSGRTYETPIAYLEHDGALLATCNGEHPPQWYRNVLAAGRATVNLRGSDLPVRVETVEDAQAIEDVFERWHRDFRGFERAFRCSPSASAEQLRQARDRRRYLRLLPQAS